MNSRRKFRLINDPAVANEMKQICDAIEVSYEDVKNLALYDERIGRIRGFKTSCVFATRF